MQDCRLLGGRIRCAVPGKARRIPSPWETLREIFEHVAVHFSWHRFAAFQIWIFVLFSLYTSVAELNARVGYGGLRKSSSRGIH